MKATALILLIFCLPALARDDDNSCRKNEARIAKYVRSAEFASLKDLPFTHYEWEYLPNAVFNDPKNHADILREGNETAKRIASQGVLMRNSDGIPYYEYPRLTAEQEKAIFLAMNLYKYQASQELERLGPLPDGSAPPTVTAKLREAARLRDRLLEFNMGLAHHVAIESAIKGDPLDYEERLRVALTSGLIAIQRFDCSLGTRLSTLAQTAMENKIKTARQRARRGQTNNPAVEAQPDARVDTSVEDRDELDARRALFAPALKKLKDVDQKIITLFYGLDGKGERPIERIARETNMSENAVKLRKMRALKELQDMLLGEKRDD